ncbi:MAG: YfhO family protein [Oscillospiraceae bacterium]
MFQQEKKYYTRAFVYALIMAAVLLLPFLILDGGYFVYYGDYNAQQIPFYKTCIRAVQSGNFGWNWQTDLGANFVGSYSFYTLGSPFFWFAALFPVEISQYLMAPLLALKIALSSLFAFIYIRRFVTKPQNALIGGLLYAFSGFSMYNIFFNHFHEAIVFFPLLLIGLEESVVNKRRGALAAAVAINAFVNYFFFIGECVFLVLYFVARILGDRRFRIGVRDFFCLAFESVCGVLIAGALFVPSIFQVLDVPRSTSILSGWNFLFYNKVQRYGLILEGMFFPGEVPARTAMFTEADAKWSSVALYLPLFSLSGVIALIKGAGSEASRRMKWVRILLPACFIIAMVPGLNSAFVLFNYSFYTRWFYMPELLCALATVYVLEHEEFDLKFGAKFCAVAAVLMALLVMLFPTIKAEETVQDGREEYLLPNLLNTMSPTVLINIGLALAMMVVLFLVIRQRKKLAAADFSRRVTAVTVACSMALGYYYVAYGRILGPYIGSYKKSVSAQIHIDDPEFYRMEELSNMNNINMLWNTSSLKSFTSIIPNSTFELYDLLGIDRTVNSAPKTEYYALRSLTHVKYLVAAQNYDEEKRDEALKELRSFRYLETQDGYDIYENTAVLPMGFAYDGYILDTDVTGSHVDNLMAGSVILTAEQAEKYGDILTQNSVRTLAGDALYEQFLTDVEDRNSMAAKQFSVNSSGFTAVTDFDRERFVVFSVPFDNGWSGSVSVKGGEYQPLELEKVNGGFIGVRLPAGVCELKFTYKTPGGTLGVVCTGAGVVLFGGYILLCYVVLRRKPRRYAHLYQADQVEGVKAHKSYISQLSNQIYESPEKGAVQLHSDSEGLSFPEIEESFMDRERYDFSSRKPKPRTSHITEDDEAFNVLKELDEQRRNKDEIE